MFVSHAMRVKGKCSGQGWDDVMGAGTSTYLLHDAGLALGEGDVATRLILDELDLDLSALAAGLVIIIVVVVGSLALAFGAAVDIAGDEGAIVVVVD
jgi:hypothetical protein